MEYTAGITKIDALIGALVGFLAGIFAIPTAYNVGVHSSFLLLSLPWAGAAGFFAGMWAARSLSSRISFLPQFAKFAAVGFLNTAIDFGVLNLISHASGIRAGLILGGVNVPGFIVAVFNSYLWNKLWVFQSNRQGRLFDDFAKFLGVTAGGLLLNSGMVIAFTTFVPPLLGLSPERWLNIAKAGATVFTLVWNFLGYKLFVFQVGK